MTIKIVNEKRKYLGPKCSQIPRGKVVRLIAVLNGKTALFEWRGERFVCPVRLLRRMK